MGKAKARNEEEAKKMKERAALKNDIQSLRMMTPAERRKARQDKINKMTKAVENNLKNMFLKNLGAINK